MNHQVVGLQPDHQEIERFVSSIFAYADPDSYISFRVFDQRAAASAPIHIEAIRAGSPTSEIVARASRVITRAANRSQPGVFAPPVATFSTPERARTGDIANGVALSVEIDNGNPLAARRKLEHILGPVTIAMHSGSEWCDPDTGELFPKQHLHWRLSEPTRDPDEHAKLREARWCATMLVGADPTAIPINHPLRWPGSWNLKGAPRLARIAAGNEAAEIHLDDALAKLREAVEAAGIQANQERLSNATPEARHDLLSSAFQAIPNHNVHWEEWNRYGMAAWRASGGSTEGYLAWCDWSAKSDKHEDAACQARWKHYETSPPTQIGAGTIFWAAAQYGWERPGPRRIEEVGMDERPIPPWEVYADGAPLDGSDAADDHERPRKPKLWFLDQPWDEEEIPKRPWVAPGFLLRHALTVVSGHGSVGKSSLMLGWCASLASGVPYGNFKPERPCKVVSYNVEDDREEQQRRFSATLRQFNLTLSDVMPNLRLIGPTEVGTLLRIGPTGSLLVNTPVMDELEQFLADYRPDVLMLDPFVELHSSEENDNTAVRQVLARFRSWAHHLNCSIVLLHHARKGNVSPGDPDSLRGASAIVGAGRVILTLAGMTEDEAQKYGISKQGRKDYFRVDGAKMNYSRLEDADWFERTPYELDNGEVIAAAVPWEAPTQTVTLDHIEDLVRAVEAGDGNSPWSPKLSRDKRSIARAMENIGIVVFEAQKELLARAMAEGRVHAAEYRDPATRQKKQGLRSADGFPAGGWCDA